MLFVGAKSCRQDSTGTKSLMGRRVLDLQKARWMTQDPIGFAGGDQNLFRYVGANPTSRVDPSGMAPCSPSPQPPSPAPGTGGSTPFQSSQKKKIWNDCSWAKSCMAGSRKSWPCRGKTNNSRCNARCKSHGNARLCCCINPDGSGTMIRWACCNDGTTVLAGF
jgi:RHS repeat-associated protein